MKKTLIATIVFNSNKITNSCFIPSLYFHTDQSLFDLLIVTTSEKDFILDKDYYKYTNIRQENFNKKYRITMHAAAIQKILDLNKDIYDDIIICENDTVIKCNLLELIDHSVQFKGQDSMSTNHQYWWTKLYPAMYIGCRRYLPMLMYFNTASFKNKELIYDKNDCNLEIHIPTLKINQKHTNTYLCDPGWYFMIWSQLNKIVCKNISIDDYISHFWLGSENRNNDIHAYDEKLKKFIEDNKEHLIEK